MNTCVSFIADIRAALKYGQRSRVTLLAKGASFLGLRQQVVRISSNGSKTKAIQVLGLEVLMAESRNKAARLIILIDLAGMRSVELQQLEVAETRFETGLASMFGEVSTVPAAGDALVRTVKSGQKCRALPVDEPVEQGGTRPICKAEQSQPVKSKDESGRG
jgi:hypothetical protein